MPFWPNKCFKALQHSQLVCIIKSIKLDHCIYLLLSSDELSKLGKGSARGQQFSSSANHTKVVGSRLEKLDIGASSSVVLRSL